MENKLIAAELEDDALENVSGGTSEAENPNESTGSELLKPITIER